MTTATETLKNELTSVTHRGYRRDDMDATFDRYVRKGDDWKRYGGWAVMVFAADICCLSAAVDFFHADELQVGRVVRKATEDTPAMIRCTGRGYQC